MSSDDEDEEEIASHQQDAAARRKAFRSRRAEENKELSYAATERRYVRLVLNEFKLGKYEQAICQRCEFETGRFDLTFRHFCDEFGTFPLRLKLFQAPQPLHESDRMRLPSLLLRFRETPFYEAFTELWRDCQGSNEGRPPGLVIPYKGLSYGLLVHTGEGLTRHGPGLEMHYRHPDPASVTYKEPAESFVVPFRSALETLYRHGRGWKPE